MAYITTVRPEEAEGAVEVEYSKAVRRAGRVSNIVRIMSLNAETLKTSMRFYLSVMKGPSVLSRAQREMVATVVSHTNDCVY